MWPQISFYGLIIPTFYLIISLSCSFIIYLLSKKLDANPNFNRNVAFNLVSLLLISGFIGGRILHVIYEEPFYYLSNPLLIFKFWNGGFVYFGGFMTALMTGYLYLKKNNQPFFKWADFLTPYFSLMYVLGRIGCFLEGCCYGRYCEWPWAIDNKHPTQLYMMFTELVLFLFLQKRKKLNPSGKLFLLWILLHCLSRFIIEFFRNDDRGKTLFNLISISQLLSLIFIFIAAYVLNKNLKSSNDK